MGPVAREAGGRSDITSARTWREIEGTLFRGIRREMLQ
jgi:hypothetical protein